MSDTDIVYGLHAVRHALRHSLDQVTELWVQADKKDTRAITALLQGVGSRPVNVVSRQALDKLTGQQRHQGIVIRRLPAKRPARDLETLLKECNTRQPLILVIDGVEDPHNLGACLRTADAAGVNAVILPKNRATGINATVSKVASGAAEHVPVFQVTNLARTLRQLQDAGLWIIGTADAADSSLYDTDLQGPVALVVGGEGRGLRENTMKNCDLLVSLPMQGIVESLNVSVATGICLYEVLRQRRSA